MTNEALLRNRTHDPIDFIVADAVAIEKGTVCKLSGARLAAPSMGNDVFAGIAAREKIVNDGRTRLALFNEGVFDMTTAFSITAGGMVSLSGANLIKQATEAEMVTGAGFGKALEAATAAGDVIQVKIGGLA